MWKVNIGIVLEDFQVVNVHADVTLEIGKDLMTNINAVYDLQSLWTI